MTGGMGLDRDGSGRLGDEADLVAETHPALAASMHADAALLAGTSGQFELAAAAAERAESCFRKPPRQRSDARCG